jgi:hypothetical protein
VGGGHDVGGRVEVVIEGALGGFVELLGIGAFVGEAGSDSGGLGVGLIIDRTPVLEI